MGAGLNDPAAGTPSGHWRGAGLTALIEALRDKGFSAGAAEAVTAGRLLQRLANSPRAPQRVQDLAPWLRPVFCRTREEQARFDPIFDEWARRIALRWETRAAAPPEAAPQEAAATRTPASRARRAAVVWFFIFATAAAVWLWRDQTRSDVPAPELPASRVAVTPNVRTVPPVREGEAGTAQALDLQGYFPAVREARTLRPETIWPLLAVPALLLLLMGGVPGLSLMQGRRRSTQQVVLDTRQLADEARQVLPPLSADVAGRLERHVRGDSAEGAPLARRRRLDARRTVEATLRNHGILSPRYRHAPLRPSYLMLIDAKDENDPRGRLFYLWAERLRRQGLAVDIRLFRPAPAEGAAPVCWRINQPSARDTGLPLDRLEDPPAGQRLVVISEATNWVESDGRWRDWFKRARLRRWPQRAFFTPTELRDWGLAEERIEAQEHAADPGFLALPLDESALSAWSELIASGSLPAFSLAEPQRYPRLLASTEFDPFAEPSPADLDRLIAQLKLYLGDSGFRWLAAMAVPPLVRWELTLLLGRALFEHRVQAIGDDWRTILARNYRRLARLPWMRSGGVDEQGQPISPRLPDWLRLRLLDELSAAAQAEIRDIVDRLLSRVRPDVGGGLALGFEVPPRPGAARASGGGAVDQLYLGYLSGLTPRQLALRLPGSWKDWLRDERVAEAPWTARLRRAMSAVGDRLAASVARFAFRDGMPWSPRGMAPAFVAAAVLAVVGFRLAGTPSPATQELLFRLDTREVRPPPQKLPAIQALAPDGRSALTLNATGRVRVWDTATGRTQFEFRPQPLALFARFDDGAERILTCNASGEVHAWSRESGESLAALAAPSQTFSALSACQIGPDGGTRLLHDDGTRTSLLITPQASGPTFSDVAWSSLSPNGRWLLTREGRGNDASPTVKVRSVYGIPDAAEIAIARPSHIAWAGDTLATLERDGSGPLLLALRDLNKGSYFSLSLDDDDSGSQVAQSVRQSARQQANAPAATPTALAVSSDGRYAAIGDETGTVSLWDVQRRLRAGTRRVHETPVERLMVSADGAQLWSVAQDGETRLSRAWQVPLASSRAALAAVSAGGQHAAFASGSGLVVVRRGTDTTASFQGLPTPSLLALSADGRTLAQAAPGGLLRLWSRIDEPAARTERTERLATDLVLLRFTGDGTRLLALSRSGTASTWAIEDGRVQEERVDRVAGRSIQAAAMRADGVLAVLDAASGMLRLLPLDGPPRDLLAPSSTPWRERGPRLAFSNQGRTVWAAAQGRAAGWDVASGRLVRAFDGIAVKGETVRDVHADDTQSLLALATGSGELQLFDTRSGNPIASPPERGQRVQFVRWLADGRLLIAHETGLMRLSAVQPDGLRVDEGIAPMNAGGPIDDLVISDDQWHLLSLGRVSRSDGRASLWALPDAVVAPPPPAWLDRVDGPHPITFAAAAMALLALLLATSERRHATRLARRIAAPEPRVVEDLA